MLLNKVNPNALKTPAAEKAQHDPHCRWFLTAETFPWVVQSTSPITGMVSSHLGNPTIGMGVKNLLANSSAI
jgi:hypothetical protein